MAKKINILIFVLIIIVIGVALAMIIRSCIAENRPPDSLVTVEGLRRGVEEDYILVHTGGKYYRIDSSYQFVELFDMSEWVTQETAPEGEPLLTFRFGESWILELYPGGQAAAHNGYAASDSNPHAYYSIGLKVCDALTDYVEEHGQPHELGDGTIGVGTFNY